MAVLVGQGSQDQGIHARTSNGGLLQDKEPEGNHHQAPWPQGTAGRQLDRPSTLEKVIRPPKNRIVLSIPFDKRFGNISGVLRHRWQCLLDRDPRTKEYMPEPPMVAYSRTRNLKEIIIRSTLPPKGRKGRTPAPGFKLCGRANCACCQHAESATNFSGKTGEKFDITSPISCHDTNVVYLVRCDKTSGACLQAGQPTYVGVCTRPVRERCGEHFGSATWPSQVDTEKPVGAHFRLPGHKAQRDFTFLPIEKVVSKDPMVKLARESYWIRKLGTMKENKDRKVIEFGLNLDP